MLKQIQNKSINSDLRRKKDGPKWRKMDDSQI
jgi:hypothetical protein